MFDCHAHVIDPVRFPFTGSTYRPHPGEWGTLERYLECLNHHGISHAVLVQPTSGYDTDHRCLVDAIGRSAGRIRGIARVRPEQVRSDAGILDEDGICGVRVDLTHDGVDVVSHRDFGSLLAVLRERTAVLQLQCEQDQLAAVLPLLDDCGVTIVVDHCGRPDPARGLVQPGFQALLELGRQGHYVKLCGAFRFSRLPFPHPDVDPFVAALLETFTSRRCVWGSDWPFLRFAEAVSYRDAVNLARRWLEQPDDLDRAARHLFGFGR